MSIAKLRLYSRWSHILLAAGLGAYFYSPLGESETYQNITKFGLFPAVALFGVLLWQAPKVVRLFGLGKQ